MLRNNHGAHLGAYAFSLLFLQILHVFTMKQNRTVFTVLQPGFFLHLVVYLEIFSIQRKLPRCEF